MNVGEPLALPSVDIHALREAVERALRDRPQRMAGGWSAAKGKGRVYEWAELPFSGGTWVVVHGPQRPSAAQLLDAAAWRKQVTKDAVGAVAWLRPAKKVEDRRLPAEEGFRARYQAAVFLGLGIVAVDSEAGNPWIWEPAEVRTCDKYMDELARSVREGLLRSRAELAKIEKLPRRRSPAAETPIRRIVGDALGNDFRRCDKTTFQAAWRSATADGVWSREGAFPKTVALEVKVAEDVGAPFNQVFDDLGKFDAVLQVRLLDEATRDEIDGLKGLHDVKVDVARKLPVRFLEIPF